MYLPDSKVLGLGKLELNKSSLNSPTQFSASSELVSVFLSQSLAPRNQDLVSARDVSK